MEEVGRPSSSPPPPPCSSSPPPPAAETLTALSGSSSRQESSIRHVLTMEEVSQPPSSPPPPPSSSPPPPPATATLAALPSSESTSPKKKEKNINYRKKFSYNTGECLSDKKPVLYLLPVSSGSSLSSSSTARTSFPSFVQGVVDYWSQGVPDISRGKITNIGTLSAIQQTLDCRNSLASLVGSKTTGAADTMCVAQSRVIFFGQHLEEQEGDYIRHQDNPRGLPTSEVPSDQAKQNHNI